MAGFPLGGGIIGVVRGINLGVFLPHDALPGDALPGGTGGARNERYDAAQAEELTVRAVITTAHSVAGAAGMPGDKPEEPADDDDGDVYGSFDSRSAQGSTHPGADVDTFS